MNGSLVPSAGLLEAISAEFSSQQSWVGGSEGPSNAAGECSSLKGKFSETAQRCERSRIDTSMNMGGISVSFFPTLEQNQNISLF